MSRTLIATLAALALASSARAQPAVEAASAGPGSPGWRVDIGSSSRFLRDPSAVAVTTESLGSFVLSAERSLASFDLPRGRSLELGAFATWGNGGAGGTMFQSLSTTIGTNDLLGGVHAAMRVWRVLGVSARAGIGATRVDLTIGPVGAAQMASVDDHGWGRIATATLGVDFDPITTRTMSLGVGVDAGYVATSAVEMHAYPSNRPDPDRSIETAYESIGHLDLDGWSLRIGAHLSF
jgi:hypothetical protein